MLHRAHSQCSLPFSLLEIEVKELEESRAFAPCSISMNVCIKLLEIVNDDLTCKASSDEVGDKELVGVSDDI